MKMIDSDAQKAHRPQKSVKDKNLPSNKRGSFLVKLPRFRLKAREVYYEEKARNTVPYNEI